MVTSPSAVLELSRHLESLGWITDLFVAGSLATGDYIPGVSDLDLVAVVDGPVDEHRQSILVALHRQLDAGVAAGQDLGCVYVDATQVSNVRITHPTWTHELLVQRILSGITRAELIRHGYSVFGRPPSEALPAMTNDDVREAARAELTGYWAWAARRPWLWLNPVIADLGLTSMARGRHSLRTGELLTKSQAVEQAKAPAWLIDHLRARRQGERISSPRLRTAVIAWRDARRTIGRVGTPDS